ncbi:MAG: 50S ribosomal protein L18 [Candidatus Margulisiibacteriota bacterium]
MAHRKIKKKIYGTAERPRLSVYRSLKGWYAQFIDDDAGKTILGVSSLTKEIQKQLGSKNNLATAKLFGEIIGKQAVGKGLSKIVFDRNDRSYCGRIQALADAARAAGLVF